MNTKILKLNLAGRSVLFVSTIVAANGGAREYDLLNDVPSLTNKNLFQRDSWIRAQVIAGRLLVDPPPDPTDGALFFHSTSIPVPWVRPRTRTARIGNHVFYR